MRRYFAIFVLSLMVLSFFTTESFAAPEEYVSWLKDLRSEMIKRGIKAEFFDKVYAEDYYENRPEVLKKDKKMVEFVPVSDEYLNRIVTKDRVVEARKKYKYAKEKYKNFEQSSVVPLNYLVAFWALETNFGKNKGRFNWVKCLTQLSYYGRRKKFFRNELFYALKILQDNDFDYTKILSSWDGGVGNFQFMPSTYAHFAVDYNNNGKIDLWEEEEDSFASAVNYLKKEGWQKDKIWGTRVELPWNFDYGKTGKKHKQSAKKWQEAGISVKIPNNMADEEAYILVPEGRRGNAYMVFKNFDVITRWNHSLNYALSVGILADYIASEDAWKKVESGALQPTRDEIKKLQNLYNRTFNKKIAEDGRVGLQTREAIKELQKKYKLPTDGYPDWRLMKRVNSEREYKNFVPVPPKQNSNNQYFSALRDKKNNVVSQKIKDE